MGEGTAHTAVSGGKPSSVNPKTGKQELGKPGSVGRKGGVETPIVGENWLWMGDMTAPSPSATISSPTLVFEISEIVLVERFTRFPTTIFVV